MGSKEKEDLLPLAFVVFSMTSQEEVVDAVMD